MEFREYAPAWKSSGQTGKFEAPPGNENSVYGFSKITVPISVTTNMSVVVCPFWENRFRIEPAPNLTDLQPAENQMDVLPFGVGLEMPVRILQPVEPAEKQEKVTFPNALVEEVGTGLIGLPEDGQPALLSDEVATDKVRVQVAEIGPFYPGFPLPMVEGQVLNHCPKVVCVIA
ncbi:MAG: hypothetical protein ABSE93_14470 [Terriglobia bacterium]